jgi:hypothetical protein
VPASTGKDKPPPTQPRRRPADQSCPLHDRNNPNGARCTHSRLRSAPYRSWTIHKGHHPLPQALPRPRTLQDPHPPTVSRQMIILRQLDNMGASSSHSSPHDQRAHGLPQDLTESDPKSADPPAAMDATLHPQADKNPLDSEVHCGPSRRAAVGLTDGHPTAGDRHIGDPHRDSLTGRRGEQRPRRGPAPPAMIQQPRPSAHPRESSDDPYLGPATTATRRCAGAHPHQRRRRVPNGARPLTR